MTNIFYNLITTFFIILTVYNYIYFLKKKKNIVKFEGKVTANILVGFSLVAFIIGIFIMKTDGVRNSYICFVSAYFATMLIYSPLNKNRLK